MFTVKVLLSKKREHSMPNLLSKKRSTKTVHFGKAHTPLHAFLETPKEDRSIVTWNNNFSVLTRALDKAVQNDSAYVGIVSKSNPLPDQYYNHGWLKAYDELDGHPYQEKLLTLFSTWWSLEHHVNSGVVNKGIGKRLLQSPELLDTAIEAMKPSALEKLLRSLLSEQRLLKPDLFVKLIRKVLPLCFNDEGTSLVSINKESSLFNDPCFFSQYLTKNLTGFERLNNFSMNYPAYTKLDTIDSYAEKIELFILSQCALHYNAVTKYCEVVDNLHRVPEYSFTG